MRSKDLRGCHDTSVLACDQTQIVAGAGIVTVIAGKEFAVAVPQREQVQHLVALAGARRPQFHG